MSRRCRFSSVYLILYFYNCCEDIFGFFYDVSLVFYIRVLMRAMQSPIFHVRFTPASLLLIAVMCAVMMKMMPELNRSFDAASRALNVGRHRTLPSERWKLAWQKSKSLPWNDTLTCTGGRVSHSLRSLLKTERNFFFLFVRSLAAVTMTTREFV